MREIKFRAWHKEKKIMIDSIQNTYDGLYFGKDEKLDLHEIDYRLVSSFSAFLENKDVEVMQYTGLKDKNGVEIYESDIVKIHIGHEEWLDKSMIVEWIDGAFCLHIPGREKVTSLIFYADGVQVRRGHRNIGQFIEVIGNLYEHPQLTEVK